MRKLAILVLALVPSFAHAAGGGHGPTLPATCTPPFTFTVDVIPAIGYDCIGTNTWRPQGASNILAIRKSVDINTINVDIALGMPPGRYFARSILLTGASTSLAATAARVGIWTGAGATGANIVTAASSATVLQALTTTAMVSEGNLGIQVTSSLTQVFLRCTVAHGSAATIDVYVMGEILP